MKLLEETYTENRFRNEAVNERTFKKMTQDFSMLILPDFMKEGYRFVYMKDENVPTHIKLYNMIQDPATMKKLGVGSVKDSL